MKSSADVRVFVAAMLFAAAFSDPPVARADRVILRDLKIVSDRTVVSFDEDGIRLDDSSVLRWDEIEKATIAPEKQAAFDKLLGEVGGHLYRIRQRLQTGDYPGLLAPAEAIYPLYSNRESATAYMVQQALMWGRLASGRRETALEPYLRCLTTTETVRATLPGERRLRFDRSTGLSGELVPVWFDAEAARAALPGVFRRIAEMPRPRPDGVYIYYGTLALAAGDESTAAKVLDAVPTQQVAVAELRSIVNAQREVLNKSLGQAFAVLSGERDGISQANRPLALYWLGRGEMLSGDEVQRRSGLLDLLRIPALFGREHPEVAAAALYHVMESLAAAGDARGSVAVRRELLERYGQTFFAAKLRSGVESPEVGEKS